MKYAAQIAVGLFLCAAAASAQHEGHGAAPPASPAKTPARPAPARDAPATAREEPRAMIEVPDVQQQRIGVVTARLAKRRVTPTLRAVAMVQVDETREAHVHTRVNGWLDDVYVSAVGQSVSKGDLLYRIYSPEIVATQQEYLVARGQGEIGRRVAQAALERLRQWGLSSRDILTLKQSGVVQRSMAVESPASGVVVEKMAVQGIYATPEMHLYRISDLSKVWVVAALYEAEVALVKEGDAVTIEVPSAPGRALSAHITYVYPEIDVMTRTGKARVEIDNPDGFFKPGMYATLHIAKDLGEVLLIPADAVIDTGARKIAFMKHGATSFMPHEVTLGPRVDDAFVVLSGVRAEDEVVVRATFLIDAESRLQAALQTGGAPQGHAQHGQ